MSADQIQPAAARDAGPVPGAGQPAPDTDRPAPDTDRPASFAPRPASAATGAPAPAPPPVTVRPRKMRLVTVVLAVAVLAVSIAVGTGLRGPTDGGVGVFRPADQVAMIILGVLMAAGILALGRPRVIADTRHIQVRNIIGGYDLPWAVVRGVRFDRSSPWVTLDLQDDEVVSVMAVQATDKEHALRAVRALRALLEASRAPVDRPPAA